MPISREYFSKLGFFLLPLCFCFNPEVHGIDDDSLSQPPPFSAEETKNGIPELCKSSIMKTVSTRGTLDVQYSFVCGNKSFYARPEKNPTIFYLDVNGLPLLNFSYWGVTKAGSGIPFNKSEPKLELNQAEKSISVHRKFESLSKDDSFFSATVKLLDDGLISLDYSCILPTGGKVTDKGLLINSGNYAYFAGEKIQVGEKIIQFSTDDAPYGEKILFNSPFSGRLTFFPDRPGKRVSIDIPEGCFLSIKEVRKESEVKMPYRYRVFVRINSKKDEPLALKLDIRESSSENFKITDSFAGINFWKNDRLHIPDFKASKNLIQNPSFEEDLHYYRDFWNDYPGTARDVFTIDEKNVFSRKRSLKVKAWKDNPASPFLATFAIPTEAQKKYTFSFYAKTTSPQLCAKARIVSGEWPKFYDTPAFTLTGEWNRYCFSFTAQNAAVSVMLQVVNQGADTVGSAWVDALQLEESETATDYAEPKISATFITPQKDNFFMSGEAIDAKLRISAPPGSSGSADCEIEDFFYNKTRLASIPFQTDANGEAIVELPIGKEIGTGLFVIRTDIKLASGESKTEFYRFNVIDPVVEPCPNKGFFAIHFSKRNPTNSDAVIKRLAYLGFGSTNYLQHDSINAIFLKYGMHNSGSGVLGYGPGTYGWSSFEPQEVNAFRAQILKRVTSEPYSDNLRDEVEKLSYVMAKTYPWIRVWFLQAESNCRKFACLEKYNDNEGFAKLLLACRAGVLRANPSLKFMFEGGPSNMNPTNGVMAYDKWLTATEKLAPDVRFDAFAIHPYRETPEFPDLDADTDFFLKMLDLHGVSNVPVYWNESIYNCPWYVPEWGLNVFKGCSTDHWYCGAVSYHMGWAERISAAYYARSYLVGLKYSDRIKQMNGWNFCITMFDIDGGIYALAKVPNTLCHILGDAKFKADIRFAVNCRAYIFEDGKGRPVAAIWSHIPDVDRGLVQSPIAKIRFDGEPPELIDMMGNFRKLKKNDDGSFSFPVTPFPVFVRSKAGSYNALRTSLASAIVSGVREFPLYVGLKLKSREEADLSFLNRISRRFEGKAQIGFSKFELSIPENSSQVFDIKLPEELPFDRIMKVSLPLKISEQNGNCDEKNFSMDAFAIAKAVSWDSVPWIKISNRKIVKFADGTRSTPMAVNTDSLEKFEASFKIRWDDESLRLLVKVTDDKPVWPKGKNNGKDYAFDSVQIYLDTLGNDSNRNIKVSNSSEDYVYTLSRDAESGKARVYREMAPEQQLAGGTDAPRPRSVVTGIDASVTMTQDGYVYEIALPKHMIVPLQLKNGYFARLSLFVNNNDGNTRVGGLVTTNGIDSEPYSNPEQWTGIILSEQ